ncbi:hypothetical protein LTR96_002936 [Exophiala xenobiotica]|nr:hypothetical protein LTR92_005196 [Exophiala xenobiotica]KAK5273304.1 hypothetical protein LTR96_002936 [Exophiala xenobiotica]KAK5341023.1 hypothetical protein LTR98_001815 [Exophiala xenobiotica]KAK5443572.1 hypothetical protein LTR18_004833 [Exophiala xenobiotica]
MPVVQLVVLPHRVVLSEAELEKEWTTALKVLQSANGLIAQWEGKKHEEMNVKAWILLWKDLESSQRFFTSRSYYEFNQAIQPALFGRRIQWNQRAFIDSSDWSGLKNLNHAVTSPALEIAWTQVVEGGVAGYHEQTRNVTGPIMDKELGCGGYFVAPSIEDAHRLMVLINWKSVDAHHQEHEKGPAFRKCIEASEDYYAVFVVPWHIVDIKLIFGQMPVF